VKDFFYGTANSQGFYPQQNAFINWLDAAPVASAGGSSSTTLVIVIVVVVALAAAGGTGIVLRRRATAGERE
jgi:hypothetical protein